MHVIRNHKSITITYGPLHTVNSNKGDFRKCIAILASNLIVNVFYFSVFLLIKKCFYNSICDYYSISSKTF